jgi:polysaccharide pyruvyl transferase WcaK-like protein
VRNDGSLERLREQTGLDLPQVPDPGFHINMHREYECNETEPFVLVQVADDKANFRFADISGDASSGRARFVTEMREVVTDLAKRYKVIFSPHVFEDLMLSQLISEGIANTHIWDFHSYAFDRAADSVGFYRDAAFVLAMRGHGQIVPISFNTPVISIENHPKHGGLMRNLGLADLNVSIHDENLATEIFTRIEIVESRRPQYSKNLSDINQRLFNETNIAFSTIASKIRDLA